jgi:asparagine N-glycosylation enzyme membrane subunit Stt3
VRIAAATGAVVQPSAAAFTTPFIVIVIIGVLASVLQRRARTTLLLVLAIAVQSAALYVVARSAGASTPYMAFKMFYLLVYPLAVLAAVGIGAALHRAAKPPASAGAVAGGFAVAVAWVLLIVAAAALREQLRPLRLPAPIVSHDLQRAGQWARAHVEAACFEYLVPHADTAYWLHLAVLGNPRITPRTADDETFDPQRNVLRWMQPGGLPYAIVDLRTASKDMLLDADQIETFGTAAILRRTGPASCPDAQRLADARR